MATFQQKEGEGAEHSVWRTLSRLRYILCDEYICKNNITLSVLCCLGSNLIFLNSNLQQGNSTQFLKTQLLISESQSCINNPNGKKSIAGSPPIVMKNSRLVHLVNWTVRSLNYALKNSLNSCMSKIIL